MLDADVVESIEQILKRGNDAEIKLVHGSVVVVEIHRKVTYRTVTTG
jgi:hypothetical protein